MYNLQSDPEQFWPIGDDALEARLAHAMAATLTANEAPLELYVRFDLLPPSVANGTEQQES